MNDCGAVWVLDFFQSFESQISSNVELIKLENDLELCIEWSGTLGDMWNHVFLNIAPEKLQKDQNLSIQAEFANDFQKLECLEFKNFYFFFASLSLFGYL